MKGRPQMVRPWWLMPLGRISPLWCIPFAVVIFIEDYFAGPDPTFPVLYSLVIFAAAWYIGAAASIGLAALAAAFHVLLLATVWQQAEWFPLASTAARATLVALFAVWIARFADHEREIEHHVRTLEGLLPICAFCKSIRNDAGKWEKLETYISDHTDAQFSHGFCPDCQKEHYPEFAAVNK